LHQLKRAYLIWFGYYPTIPKIHRYTLAAKIDDLLVETIEMGSAAAFSPPREKLPYLRAAVRKLDTAKLLLMVLWETKSLDNRKYVALSEPIQEAGRMLGGWHNSVLQKQSPQIDSGAS
jgi:hypothetical protein